MVKNIGFLETLRKSEFRTDRGDYPIQVRRNLGKVFPNLFLLFFSFNLKTNGLLPLQNIVFKIITKKKLKSLLV